MSKVTPAGLPAKPGPDFPDYNELARLRHENFELRKQVEELKSRLCWAGYVDTASGAFTQNEIDRTRGWY